MSEAPGFRFFVPPELEAGAYANAVAVSHSPHELTIDFGVVQTTHERGEVELEEALPTWLVARIRIPPTFAFELIRAINGRMTQYEAEWGEIAPRRFRQKGDDP